jgi:Protein of unknown function (DUF3987)
VSTNGKPDNQDGPTLDPAALYGLAGDVVRGIGEETEADPAALLVTLLAGFGNAAGPHAHMRVHSAEHPGRLFAAVVGATSDARKGTSFAAIKPFLMAMDPQWFEDCQLKGFGSGEAVIAHFNPPGAESAKFNGDKGEYDCANDDDQDDGDGDGDSLASEVDRRAFIKEEELSGVFKVNTRSGSTSSNIFRSAWDGEALENRTRRGVLKAKNVHISLLGHITPDELQRTLGGSDVSNGFANRILFVLARRVRKIASGGSVPANVVSGLGLRLHRAVEFAKTVGVMTRDGNAEAQWERIYHAEPTRPGIVGVICGRGEAQMLRLSVIYALLDESTTIRVEHVLAAEAFWRYCVATVEYIWPANTTSGSIAQKLLAELRRVYPNGLARSEQSRLFSGHKREQVARARAELIESGLAREEQVGGRGRPSVILFAANSAAN